LQPKYYVLSLWHFVFQGCSKPAPFWSSSSVLIQSVHVKGQVLLILHLLLCMLCSCWLEWALVIIVLNLGLVWWIDQKFSLIKNIYKKTWLIWWVDPTRPGQKPGYNLLTFIFVFLLNNVVLIFLKFFWLGNPVKTRNLDLGPDRLSNQV